VDLPKNVTAATLTKAVSSTPNLPVFRKKRFQIEAIAKDNQVALEKLAHLLSVAKKPILYVGAGAMNASKEVRELAELCDIPVTTTLQGMGIFDELNPLSLHMLGMHGSAYANFAMQRADLIISLGARFDDRVTGSLAAFAPVAKAAAKEGRGGIVHFDIMPKNVNKVVKADIAVVGDVKERLVALRPLLQKGCHKEWVKQCTDLKAQYPYGITNIVTSAKSGKLRPQAVIQEMNKQLEHMKEKVYITTGVGQHQMWAAQYYRWRHPRTFITSGGLGTMGFGLPSAIGAKVAAPDAIVIDIDGDASFSMTGMELATASQYNIGVKVLLLNNDFQGMVKQWQDLFYDERYSGTPMVNPDWVKLAEAMRMKGLRVTTEEELPRLMAEFLAHDGPIVMEAVVCKEEHVYPMVPAGRGLDEMVLGDQQ
jgi:acetolactate synthase-1/2/3 large subunit